MYGERSRGPLSSPGGGAAMFAPGGLFRPAAGVVAAAVSVCPGYPGYPGENWGNEEMGDAASVCSVRRTLYGRTFIWYSGVYSVRMS